MTPAWTKTLMTLGAALLAAAGFIPQLRPYWPALAAFGGVLFGGAHWPEPATAAQLTARAAKAVEAEK